MAPLLRIRLAVRLPVDLHRLLREAARENDRSLNAEIVHRLRDSFSGWVR